MPVLNDKKIIAALIKGDEKILAFVIRKYSGLLWKIAASILINAASAQEVEECVADVFIHLWQHPEKYEKGYQTLQALYAIGSGGLFGKGLGAGMQKLGFVPEAQNDMIFSIICEELGLFGAICVILLFAILIWRFMVIASNAQDLYGALLVTGVMAHISIQVILNIAVVSNSIPNTGISLPFISYGGTSVLFLMAEIGMALGVSRGIPLEE